MSQIWTPPVKLYDNSLLKSTGIWEENSLCPLSAISYSSVLPLEAGWGWGCLFRWFLHQFEHGLSFSRIASLVYYSNFVFYILTKMNSKVSRTHGININSQNSKPPRLAPGQLIQADGVPQSPKQITHWCHNQRPQPGAHCVCGKGGIGKTW